ncbi:zinc carboxypeptidase [Kribbella turkmenica]|uniref:Zinc carboxypeptidase n=1 Tax=Kribbella turkmenica TaxID=2530375 RepID=A0A4R4WEY1_9ACTN|nr:M14 family metallopeptidase [Kribbella turkmenica]TDD17608.1 zinc carboxypeptidase [Kribbella turkmenica]
MRRSAVVTAVLAVLAGALVAGPGATAAPAQGGGDGLEVYVGELDPQQLQKLADLGVDRQELSVGPKAADGKARVEVVITDRQATKLRTDGVDLTVKKVNGRDAADEAARLVQAGPTVFRPYSGPGGLREELVATADAHSGLAKLVTVGSTVQGKQIEAVKVTKHARHLKDGTRPAVLYMGAQHAREWITPEMVRRLMHHVIDNYGQDAEITKLVDTTELWFLPVANPDGYDYTFTGDRLWRKNLRDNNADGATAPGDGVDLNRNFPFKWGYDNEGSSPDPFSETYRGTAPASEPEIRAVDRLFRQVGFTELINYHSAAELILYGVGWQVSTPTPDDVIAAAMAGDDANPAVPGYDPDISAELYTTNGETDGHASNRYGILAFTPEMSTCQAVSAADPDDEWLPEDCVSVFTFPDDEGLIQAEFAKNVPFALSVAKSAHDPDDPVSVVGKKAADLVADPFEVSHGTTQPVAVTAKRALKNLRLNYRINGGRTVSDKVSEWKGGERYGDTDDHYYAEFRGTVRRTTPGDSVEVWFTGVKPGTGPVASDHFTYTVATDIGGKVLILAAEDVTGISPAQGVTTAKYADEYATALTAAGNSSDVYDVDANNRTAPHHLGVLSHYQAVVWETGDDIITRETGQVPGTAAELALDLELTVRDYLNEGGKLLHTGKYAGFASSADGSYFYNPFEEEQGECTTPQQYPCLPLLNDFAQYWLGAYRYVDNSGTDANGNPVPIRGTSGAFNGFAGTLNGGDSADNQDHTAAFVLTSSVLPKAQFPQFASSAPLEWDRPGVPPFDPFTGAQYMYSQQGDISYKRLTRTVNLAGVTSGALSFKISYDTEAAWDFVMVEAHTVGQDDWTTLPDTNGHTSQDTGQSCPSGWIDLHPFLAHYQGTDCSPTGTTGAWHAAAGSSAGWQDWNVDLTPYAGKQVEVSITYVSDWGTQGLGVFVDDTTVTAGTTAQTSFETDLGGWTVAGPPAGSAANPNDWIRTTAAFDEGAGVTTRDTVYVGFGAEGLTTQAMRTDLVRRSIAHLFGAP